jgi:hypothetical protein
MILRPVSPESPIGPPTTKRPVGLMKILVSLVEVAVRHHVLDDPLVQVGLDLRVLDIGAVLRGDDDGVDAHRLAVVVLDRDLALAVGPQVGQRAVLADVVSRLHSFCARSMLSGM